MTLFELKPGQSAEIERIDEKCALRERLWDMGLVKGTSVTLLHSAPFSGPLEILLRNYHLTLRADDAKLIYLRKT